MEEGFHLDSQVNERDQADLLWNAGYRKEALAVIKEAFDKNPGSEVFAKMLANYYENMGDYIEAAGMWKTYADKTDALIGLRNQAHLLLKGGYREEALAVMEYAFHRYPESVGCATSLAYCMQSTPTHTLSNDSE
jgi:tetratricopeptide (TPR) repeat protein